MENVSKKAIEALYSVCEYYEALGSLSNSLDSISDEIHCSYDLDMPYFASLERYIDDAMMRIARDYGEIRSALQRISPDAIAPKLSC